MKSQKLTFGQIYRVYPLILLDTCTFIGHGRNGDKKQDANQQKNFLRHLMNSFRNGIGFYVSEDVVGELLDVSEEQIKRFRIARVMRKRRDLMRILEED